MIFIDYIIWHYTVAPSAIWEIMGNYIKGAWHRFLITRHLQTLFAPWHKRQPSDLAKKGDATAKVLDLMADFYIRILAAGARLLIVFFGFLFQAIIFIGFILFFVLWVLWPIVAIYFVIRGLILVF
ncbi:MAG: hypothetical protein COV29_04580 [Candidatus Yanofskybacteria bacterium CG10_big_fil_rev_8_21_14_0_10_36_16]|uniref:Uncharacterized protein n=1 Tax=Candidatus Yanofskybacteria bacterium CG10_big_fil_rev_8_21_14_0_10_36_16 TaxID=1975096 RepID=A0A2J0Q6M9_9BACT|nr:MAG: hypothetical protein COV29_04580 [Candidatus Yanofskybacteria bacterium CG10_big_fil_rev_8_21_14_0_10_36_16]